MFGSRFISFLQRSSALAAGLALVSAVVPAKASDLQPGDTLDPIPVVSLPTGLTLERTLSQDFDISWVQTPFVRHVTGTVTQNIYRMADDTLLFRYYVSNDSSSSGAITEVAVRDFSDGPTFDTDVTLANSLICINCENADRAIRDIFGGGINFQYDLGIATGYNSRAMIVKTNATSYDVSACAGRLYHGNARVTIRSGTHSQTLCGFANPVLDSTPPVVSMTSPAPLACVCNPAVISGTAYDGGGLDHYDVEYSVSGNGPWTLISTSTTAVNPAGTLATWDTTAIAQGYYFLRLTATNYAGLTNSVTSVIYIDKQFDIVDIRSPQTGNILGGTVCFDGTVQDGNSSLCFNHYTVDYAPLPAGAPFLPVNPASPTYTSPVWTDGLASWNTVSGGAAVPDGSYRVRVVGVDDCGNSRTVTRDITIDNTRPIGVISSPAPCTNVNGSVTVSGIASDAHMSGWTLQYTGGASSTWTTIASGNSNVPNGVLGVWNTAGLRPCAYTLRLIVGDASSVNCGSTDNQAEYTVSVNVGCPGDFNRDGVVNSQDYFDFLTSFFSVCP